MAEKTSSPDLLDPRKNPDLHRVSIKVTSETDFIAKIDVTGLKPNTKYIYAFSGTLQSEVLNGLIMFFLLSLSYHVLNNYCYFPSYRLMFVFVPILILPHKI